MSPATRSTLHPLPTNTPVPPKPTRGRRRKQPAPSDVSPEPPAGTDNVKQLDIPLPALEPPAEPVTLEIDEDEVPVYMSPEEASMILQVLQKIDSDHLLDEHVHVAAVVFSHSKADRHEVETSLRSLLEESNDISLRHVYKAAKDFSHRHGARPRRRSATWERTRKFCDLFIQLLHELVLSKGAIAANRLDVEPEATETKDRPPKQTVYALFQQLPTGAIFTSGAELSKAQLAGLPLAQAEPVAVVPNQPIPIGSLPTLSTLVNPPPTKRRPVEAVPYVAQVPYEAFQSYAPSFATAASHVEQHDTLVAFDMAKSFRKWERKNWPSSAARLQRDRELPRTRKGRRTEDKDGLYKDSKAQKRRREADPADDENLERAKRRKHELPSVMQPEHEQAVERVTELGLEPAFVAVPAREEPDAVSNLAAKDLPELDPALFEYDLRSSVDTFLADMDKQHSVQTLLGENAVALQELAALQEVRFRMDGAVTEGSAELHLAKAIEGNLAALVNYQPRTSAAPDEAPLVPRAEFLRKLHQTFPSGPASAFKGVLRPDQPAALKDNTTIRAGVAVPYDGATQAPQYPQSTAYPLPPSHAPQQRYSAAPRHQHYGGTPAYGTPAHGYVPHGYTAAAQAYGTPYAGAHSQAYSQYNVTPYGANGQGYGTAAAAAAGYSAYSSPQQPYDRTAYAGYGYNPGQTYAATSSYTPAHHQVARPPLQAATLSPWTGQARPTATALPHHMRPAGTRSGTYSATPGQGYTAWPRA